MRVTQHEPLSPLWWVTRLHDQMVERQAINKVYGDYYLGIHPVPWLPPQAREDFARLLALTTSNYVGLVVDAQVERQEVVGFRINTPGADNSDDMQADEDSWRLWQHNELDSYYDMLLLESAITGSAYILVEPDPKDSKRPRIHIEHPDQVIVEHVPGTNRRERAAALKVWIDDWTEKTFATLYLPDAIYKFQTGTTFPGMSQNWQPRELTRDDRNVGRNPYGLVPIWESPNNPRLLTGGRSEIDDLLTIQDRINKVLADRLLTQDFGAFPQKWASGWPEEDASGNPTPKIQIGRDRILTTDVPEAKFGQFSAADLDGYNKAKREDVKDMASRSRTPAQYLLGEVANVSGDTLRLAESGLVAKVKQRCRPHSTTLESAMRFARELSGLPKLPDGVVMEALWRNPEFRTEGELVDALVKMSTIGVPKVALWERWGATPSEIARWQIMAEEEQAAMLAMDPLTTLAGRYRDSASTSQNDSVRAGNVQAGNAGSSSAADNPNDIQTQRGAGSSARRA